MHRLSPAWPPDGGNDRRPEEPPRLQRRYFGHRRTITGNWALPSPASSPVLRRHRLLSSEFRSIHTPTKSALASLDDERQFSRGAVWSCWGIDWQTRGLRASPLSPKVRGRKDFRCGPAGSADQFLFAMQGGTGNPNSLRRTTESRQRRLYEFHRFRFPFPFQKPISCVCCP